MTVRLAAAFWKACGCGLLIGLAGAVLSSSLTLPGRQSAQLTATQAYLEHLISTPPDKLDDSSPPSGPTPTIDNDMQVLVKSALYSSMIQNSAWHSTAVIIETNTGAIKAMASLDNPNHSACRSHARCAAAMPDSAISAWEPGSVMKPLLLAAAFDQGTITPGSRYYDTGQVVVHGRSYINATLYPPQTMTIQDILNKSLNTGAIHVLKSLGGGSLNARARQTWYDYLTNHYHFGSQTGIELPAEAAGEVRQPDGGRDIQTQYAGAAFGVGVSVTPVQLVAAYGALVNGGTYYRPHLTFDGSQDIPRIIDKQVIAKPVSDRMIGMLQQVLTVNNPDALRAGYILGSKSGTAPAIGQDGAYKIGSDNGVYVGFIGKNLPHYIILVQFDEPRTKGFASSAARDTWTEISNNLIDHGKID